MSLIVDKKDLTAKEEAQLLKLSKIQELRTNFNPFPKTYKLYADMGKYYIFPRAIGIKGKTWQEYHGLPDYKIKFKCNFKLFTGNGGSNPDDKNQDRNQVADVNIAITELREKGFSFLEWSTGYGKTRCFIETIRLLERRALVVVFNSALQDQSFKEIKKNTDARVYWFRGNKVPPPDAQIVVCGLVKAAKCDIKFLSSFQMVVLDECDQTAAISYLPLFLKCCPTYLLGLSATIKKSNGLEKMMYKYFGPKEGFIYRFITKPNSSVIKYQTNFVPNIETKVNVLGDLQVDQHEINKSLAENVERNRLIADLVYEKSQDGQCLVLSPRKENIFWLYEYLLAKVIKKPKKEFLTAYNEFLKPKWKAYIKDWPIKDQAKYISDHSKRRVLRETAEKYYNATKQVDFKTVGKKDIDKESRILIGGLMSCGRGFDCKAKYVFILGIPPNLTQFAGRLRDPFGSIYIFVDKWEKFESDWTRKSMPYLRQLGCKIFFQNQGDEEYQPYIVQRKKKEPVYESILGEMSEE